MKKITAIILSGGKSSRMKGPFKPLMPVGPVSALERSVRMFRSAGVDDIRCVTGHNHEALSALLNTLGVREVINKRHEEGMLSSIQAGVANLDADCSAFLILPVDIPLVRRRTVQRLCEAWGNTRSTIFYPTFKGTRGHPPLISACHSQEIINWQGGGGLQGFLAQYENTATDLPVADASMLMDMDTMEDYQRISRSYERHEIPTVDECQVLMEEVLKVDEAIINHCEAVAEFAITLGKAVNESGGDLNLDLVEAAARLHDIARAQKDHASVGAALLRDQGFPAVADIVALHMDISPRTEERLSEAELLFLADKHISKSHPVTLAQRFGSGIKKYGENPDAAAAIQKRYRAALAIEAKIERSGVTI